MYKGLLPIVLGSFLIFSCQQGGEPETKQIEGKDEARKEVVQKEDVKGDEIPDKKKTTLQTNGESIFKAKGCASCHLLDKDTVGPSLETIAKKYEGKRENLIKFMKGEEKAIVWPDKFRIMEPQLNITKNMSDEELSALVDYMMKH